MAVAIFKREKYWKKAGFLFGIPPMGWFVGLRLSSRPTGQCSKEFAEGTCSSSVSWGVWLIRDGNVRRVCHENLPLYNDFQCIYHDIPIKNRYTVQLITWMIHSKVLNYRRVWNKMNILRWLERPCGAYPKYLWDRKWKESFHKPSSNGMGWPGVFSCIFQGVVGLIEVWIQICTVISQFANLTKSASN